MQLSFSSCTLATFHKGPKRLHEDSESRLRFGTWSDKKCCDKFLLCESFVFGVLDTLKRMVWLEIKSWKYCLVLSLKCQNNFAIFTLIANGTFSFKSIWKFYFFRYQNKLKETYRTYQSVGCRRHDMQRRVDILIILSHVKHHSLTERWRNALSLDWNAIFVHRCSHAAIEHYVILFLADGREGILF